MPNPAKEKKKRKAEIDIQTDRKIKHMNMAKAIFHKGFRRFSGILHRFYFCVVGKV
jgi:hypothetical protein